MLEKLKKFGGLPSSGDRHGRATASLKDKTLVAERRKILARHPRDCSPG